MSVFNQLKQQLSQQLNTHRTVCGLVQLSAEVAFHADSPMLLAWLKQQSCFPHYFWQSRDKQRTLAAVGAVKHFDSTEQAQAFVEHSAFDSTLIGGVQFNGKVSFILPRLLLIQTAEKLQVRLCFDSALQAEEAALYRQILADLGEGELPPFAPNAPTSSTTACDFAAWQQNITRALHAIERQQFNKVVLANAKTFGFTAPISPYQLLNASLKKNLGCYHFLYAENAAEAFLGASPERLYQRVQQQLHTEALAGTASVTADAQQTEHNALWLLSDPKNIHENQLVVDNILTHLQACTATVEVSPLAIKRLHNVQHLCRTIQIRLKTNVSDCDCLARIHPTAAVAGLPRAQAMQFIAQHEPFSRDWYAGTLGFFSRDNAEFCVTIRSAQIQQNHITLYAGAGIVAGSDAASEWQEIERKALAMAVLLEMTE